jgi:hypothetical protein
MKYSNVATAIAFHGSVDSIAVKHLDDWWEGVEIITGERHIVTQTRTLRYRFYPHFHLYARELTKRLIEKSLAGLQAADTDYVQNPDGAFQTLPFSFQAALPVGLALKLPIPGKPTETEAVTLPGGVTVTLQDGARIKLADGAEATLPGGVIAHGSQRGARVTLADGKTVDLDLGAVVSLSAAVKVTLPEAIFITGEDGELRRLTEPSIVEVPSGTNVELLGGKPLPVLFRKIFTDAQYAPTDLVEHPYPARDLDFSSSGAYSVYNWELFYHVPLAVAVQLSKNQRYEEAQRWFHYIFDPTDDSDGPTPERFWKVKPFQFTEVKQIEEILVNLSSGADSTLKQDTINSIGAWKDSPFRPHLVARYRQAAYMFKAVMAYLDNLIAWGDDLFRQDTGETINEATQIYVLAALILGERPQVVPKKGSLAPLTYASRRGKWDEFDNTLEKMESEIPFDLAPFPMSGGAGDQFATLRSVGASLYFCVPRNDKLMGYWDTVADRLFKIRNSLNLQGVFRQLPLFEPPIDPALLARAAAAGLDIGAVVAGVNQPLPLVRFQLLAQKATEICQEVKSLGAGLLSAMEKEDNEALAILRAKHEKAILGLTETVKYAQWQEAIKSKEALLQSLSSTVQRMVYYERQLGKQADEIEKAIPSLDELDEESLAKVKFAMQEPAVKPREIGIDLAKGGAGTIGSATLGLLGAGDVTGGRKLNNQEAEELNNLELANELPKVAKALQMAAKGLSYIPDFPINLHFWGLGGTIVMGGTKLAAGVNFAADAALAEANDRAYGASRASRLGSYVQRERDWAFQSATAAGEINQIFKQLRAAQIRESIAEREWRNHQQQMEHAQQIENFLTNEKTGKKTNQGFYAWLKREVRGMYGQVFQFAYDAAKKAERALQHELGKSDLSFLQYGYMSGKEGLLAGEKLYFDLKRMEMAYHELNQREYELTKYVSLLQVSPLALIQLRASGRCAVILPEELFDMDGPGHYFRRIKNVALSIPCVAGPYTSVNCTLTLTKSSIRKETGVGDGYARQGAEDSRFSDHYGSLQTIVTSTGQNDSGMFETNLHDERYLPFEGSGVVSEWQLELPADLRQFDYNTITDVILHLRYTAREGGGLLRKGAVADLTTRIEESQSAGSVRLFSARHEFPAEWAKLKSVKIEGATKAAELTLKLREEHYPFWSKGRVRVIKRMELFVRAAIDTPGQIEFSSRLDNAGALDPTVTDTLSGDPDYPGLRRGKLDKNPLPKPIHSGPEEKFTIFLNDNSMKDLWIAITWGK